jgi:hypothetical protein
MLKGLLHHIFLRKHETAPFLMTLLATYFMLVSYLAYSSILKMEATYSFETSVAFQQTTWHYIPKDTTLYSQQLFLTRRGLLYHMLERKHWVAVF